MAAPAVGLDGKEEEAHCHASYTTVLTMTVPTTDSSTYPGSQQVLLDKHAYRWNEHLIVRCQWSYGKMFL